MDTAAPAVHGNTVAGPGGVQRRGRRVGCACAGISACGRGRQSLDLVPLPVFLNIWKSADDKDTVLHGLAGADAPGVVRPPSIENVSTGHLGSGLRVYRVTRPDPDSPELLGIIAYAFRCEEYATDIHLQAVSYDLGFLQACLDGLDEFAGCIVCTRSPDVMET